MLLAALTVGAVLGASRETLVVLATSVNVRAEPAATAEQVGSLRINAGVEIVARRTGWAQVSYSFGGSEIVRGWVQEKLLGREQPHARGRGMAAVTAEDAAERLTQLERAVAVNAEDAAMWERLEQAYAAANKRPLADWAKRVRTGGERTYVAGCLPGLPGHRRKSAVLVAAVDPTGQVAPLTWEGESPIGREVAALRFDLAASRWYPVGARASDEWDYWSYPFAAPRIYVEGDGRAALELGPCPGRLGDIFVTQPIREVPFEPALPSAGAPVLLRHLAARRKVPVEPLRTVSLSLVAGTQISDLMVCWGDGNISRGLFDPKGALLVGREVGGTTYTTGACDVAGPQYPWIELHFGRGEWKASFMMHWTEVPPGMDGYHEAQLCLPMVAAGTFKETCVAYSHSDL